jgi:hypothetical protein
LSTLKEIIINVITHLNEEIRRIFRVVDNAEKVREAREMKMNQVKIIYTYSIWFSIFLLCRIFLSLSRLPQQNIISGKSLFRCHW